MSDASSLAPALWGIPVVADAASRDAAFPLATRSQDQRVFRKDLLRVQRWVGSTWSNDTPLPIFDVTLPPYNATGDGVTNDRAAIQAAITAAAVAGGIVYLPPGTYYLSGVGVNNGLLQLAANVHIRGAGQGATIIKKDPTSIDCTPFRMVGTAGGARVRNISIRGLTIDGQWDHIGGYAFGYNGIYLTNVDGAIVSDVEVTNCRNDGVVLEWCRYAVVDKNDVHDNGKVAIYSSASDRGRITNNTCRNNFAGIAVAASWWTVVSHNTCSGNTNNGIGGGRDSRHCTIVHNDADGFYVSPEVVSPTTLPFAADHPGAPLPYDGVTLYGFRHTRIAHNNFHHPTTSPVAQPAGYFSQCDDCWIEGNSFSYSTSYGLQLASSRRCRVLRNKVFNSGTVGVNRDGIVVNNLGGAAPASDANVFDENWVFDDTGSAVMYGFNLLTGVTNTVITERNRVTTTNPYQFTSVPTGPVSAIKTANYAVTVDDTLVRGDTTAGVITVTLPNASDCYGKRFEFKRVNAGANAMTIATASGNINPIAAAPAASITLTTQGGTATVRSNGTTFDQVA